MYSWEEERKREKLSNIKDYSGVLLSAKKWVSQFFSL